MVTARPGLVRDRRFRVEAAGSEAVPDQVRADRDALKVPDEVPEDDRVGVDDAGIQEAGIPVSVQLVLQFLSVKGAHMKKG